jgi:hypothetical protein
MQILRFEDAPEVAPKRKKSSAGWIGLGLVAALFGVSTAFASSSITINGDAPVALGQGVSAVTACDESIKISPSTGMKVVGSTPTFFLTSLSISEVDRVATNATTGLGCGGKTFDIQLFHGTGGGTAAYTCAELKHSSDSEYVTYLDGTSKTTTSNCSVDKISFLVPTGDSAGDWAFTIPFDDAPAVITYFTLVSRA